MKMCSAWLNGPSLSSAQQILGFIFTGRRRFLPLYGNCASSPAAVEGETICRCEIAFVCTVGVEGDPG